MSRHKREMKIYPPAPVVESAPAAENVAILATEPYTLRSEPQNATLRFYTGGMQECLRFEANGDVYVRGSKVDTDREVYECFRAWLGAISPPRDAMLEEAAAICDRLHVAPYTVASARDCARAIRALKGKG